MWLQVSGALDLSIAWFFIDHGTFIGMQNPYREIKGNTIERRLSFVKGHVQYVQLLSYSY